MVKTAKALTKLVIELTSAQKMVSPTEKSHECPLVRKKKSGKQIEESCEPTRDSSKKKPSAVEKTTDRRPDKETTLSSLNNEASSTELDAIIL